MCESERQYTDVDCSRNSRRGAKRGSGWGGAGGNAERESERFLLFLWQTAVML